MENEFNKPNFRELENQLSCPNGEIGIQVAHNMNESNFGMTENTINFLDIESSNTILELGHGNCGHLKLLLSKATDLNYYGLEISETMFHEAKKINHEACHCGDANFSLYNGLSIPFKENFFDRIFSVNTIYFWENPSFLIENISEVLHPNGYCVLTFADKTFMEQLPFVGDKFTLYDKNRIQTLIQNTNLQIVDIKEQEETIKSKTGETVNRIYFMIKLSKKA